MLGVAFGPSCGRSKSPPDEPTGKEQEMTSTGESVSETTSPIGANVPALHDWHSTTIESHKDQGGVVVL